MDDYVTRIVKEYEDVGVGCDILAFGVRSTTLPLSSILRTVEVLGRDVIPPSDTDRLHVTSRNREAATR